MPSPMTNSSTDVLRFTAHGKLLLSGEYFVLDGAKALALPTKHGQNLEVIHTKDTSNTLHWKSIGFDGKAWFEGQFNWSDLNLLKTTDADIAKRLQGILAKARELNPSFLPTPSKKSIEVRTHLEFPREWGLGTSSTLLYNISQWAGVDPYQLLAHSFGGSGYDLACAGAEGPILYQKLAEKITVSPCVFDPPFKAQLFFVYLGKKQNSRQGIAHYRQMVEVSNEQIDFISGLSQKLLEINRLETFETLLEMHETFIAEQLSLEKVKSLYFHDYWGSVKSLGAWGGDFVLVSSDRDLTRTKSYFSTKGFDVFIPYSELILDQKQSE